MGIIFGVAGILFLVFLALTFFPSGKRRSVKKEEKEKGAETTASKPGPKKVSLKKLAGFAIVAGVLVILALAVPWKKVGEWLFPSPEAVAEAAAREAAEIAIRADGGEPMGTFVIGDTEVRVEIPPYRCIRATPQDVLLVRSDQPIDNRLVAYLRSATGAPVEVMLIQYHTSNPLCRSS